MTKKPSLYEILDVPETADAFAIEHAWTTKLAALEQTVATGVDVAELASRKQIIRLAASTLLDSSSRLVYDAELARNGKLHHAGQNASPAVAAQHSAQSTGHGFNDLALVPVVASTAARDSINLRADALALRADAMSLRADAMILQSGAAMASSGNSGGANGWLRFVPSGPILRIAVFLGVMCLIALGWARCSANMPMQRNAVESKASEKVVLQEYFQTHGVRPANMAEMELLEAERRRRSNEGRNEQQNTDQKVKAEAKFEEDSRRRAQDVSDRLRMDEERQRMDAEQQQLNTQRENRETERLRNERKDAERAAEERRIQKLEGQWQQIIRR